MDECPTAAGCGAIGGAITESPGVPLPRSIATVLHAAVPAVPVGVDPPLEDRPPRSV